MKQPNLLLLHGALGAADQFTALLPFIAKAVNVHTPDFEGHGRAAPKRRPFRADYFMENILDYMDKNRLATVDIFGYSMGGHVGLCLAQKHPERVNSVFTFATKFQWTPETAATEAAYLDPDRIARKAPEFGKALAARHTGSGWKTVLAKTREMTLYQGLNNSLTEANLRRIPHPVRLSMGDRDTMVDIEETIRTYRLLPNAQLQIFPDTPHPIERVSVKMLANAVNSFLR